MRSQRALGLLLLCLAISVVACGMPLVSPAAPPAASTFYGIDPTLPHAQALLTQACEESSCTLRLMDPATGNTLAGYPPVDLGKYATESISSDGRMVATIVYPSNVFGPVSGPAGGVLQLVDLATWQLITTTLTFNESGSAPRFSPDGTQLIISGMTDTWPPTPLLHLVDVARQVQLAETSLVFRPLHMTYTTDGQSILLYGTTMGTDAVVVNPQVYVAQLNATDLRLEWQTVLPELRDGLYNADGKEPYTNFEDSFTWQPAVVFARDAAQLYLVHADQNRLTTVDFDRQRVETTALAPAHSWIERLLALTARTAHAKVMNGVTKQALLSPDGKRLYVIGTEHAVLERAYEQTPLGVQVIDVAQRAEVAHIQTAATTLRMTPDGAHLLLQGWKDEPNQPVSSVWTTVLDTHTLQAVEEFPDYTLEVGRRLDGQPLLFSIVNHPTGGWTVTTIDPASFDVIGTWLNPVSQGWVWFVTHS